MQVESSLQDVQKDQLHNQGSLVIGQCSSLHYCFLIQHLQQTKMEIDRFRLKEEEKGKKLSKALQSEDVQALDSASDEDSDEETKDKVNPKF
jgi:hypothetical protein